jgi:hypothetical protein
MTWWWGEKVRRRVSQVIGSWKILKGANRLMMLAEIRFLKIN